MTTAGGRSILKSSLSVTSFLVGESDEVILLIRQPRGTRIPDGFSRSITRTETEALQNLEPREEPEPYDETPLTKVYFLLDADACQVKIGITGNLTQRIANLNSERGRKLDLLGTMTGGYDLERAMHGRFHRYRVEGREWYSSEIVGELVPLLAA